MPPFRLIVDDPLDGPANMAHDEALLASIGARQSPPTLRFYAWTPATISLGYFQEFAEYGRLEPPAAALPVVRRTTGGGAILHDLELTYSLVVPSDHRWLARGPNALYELMHRAIIHAVGPVAQFAGCNGAAGVACDQSAQRGPFFCFARRHALDVVATNCAGVSAKLAGSAQRRTRDTVLQHGSLILESHFEQQPCAQWSALDGPTDYREAALRLQDALIRTAECQFRPGQLTPCEKNAAEVLRCKYGGSEWTQRR